MGGVGNADINGNPIAADGSHGHMLIYEKKPGKGQNGALMIGIENCGYGKKSIHGEKHGLSGTSTAKSPFGAPKFRDFAADGAMFLPDSNLPIPALANERKEPLGEMRVLVTKDLLQKAAALVSNYKEYAGLAAGIEADMISVRSVSSLEILAPKISQDKLGALAASYMPNLTEKTNISVR